MYWHNLLWRASGAAMVIIAALPVLGLDLNGATIVTKSNSAVVAKAAEMLQEELAERSGVTLAIAAEAPAEGVVIELGVAPAVKGINVPKKAEGYGVTVNGNTVKLAGFDDRGAMFAAGRLIRLATYGPGTLALELAAPISTSPEVPIRAHQLAYRDTANTYDAWSLETYEQYIRDLVIFGCNGVELINNLDPTVKDGKVMTETMHGMNIKLSGLIDSYGIDVWVWSPVMADEGEDVTTPEGLAVALEKRRAFLKDFPAVDHIFVPGGDDGDAPAEHLLTFLEALSPILKELHPTAKLWVSNQTFTLEENDYFFSYLEKEDPQWLEGLVYGPWTKMGWEEMRERTPKRFPLRRYPDINHTVRCQYGIPDWDPVFANTVGREPMMPMPAMQQHIFQRYMNLSDGFGTYSDGIHDDLNKFVWNTLGWDPAADLDAALREYGKVWFGEALADDVAKGMRLFEECWQGPILENKAIPKSLALWEGIAKKVPDWDTNWRAQMYLFRARFDANVQAETKVQRGYENEANAFLAKAKVEGVATVIDKARAALAKADTPAAPELRAGIEALGPVLLKSIGYQLSAEAPYLARNSERGALLDWLDQPVNNRPWLEQRFSVILAMEKVEDQLAAIDEIRYWENPGPGGFYDDLGNIGKSEHVVYQQSWEEDPSACHTARVEFPFYKADQATIKKEASQAQADNMVFKEERAKNASAEPKKRQELRMSWQSQVATLYGTPLKMHYDGLDPKAQYTLKVTYAGRFKPSMTLTLNDEFSIHGPVPQPDPIWPVSYYLPREATKDGTLDVEWNLVEGRGCVVAEVWLIKN
jgi:hypothetical protein